MRLQKSLPAVLTAALLLSTGCQPTNNGKDTSATDDTAGDTAADTAQTDSDLDGVNDADDCNDADASIYPGAEDAWYDGVDSDCAGNDDFDADGDGYGYAHDCNDWDAARYPDASGSCTTAPAMAVDLGTAGDFVILAKSGISTVPPSAITGDIGVSPVAATYITGFSLIADATNVFSTSTQVTGHVYAADYAVPTPAKMTTAVGDMELAFTDAASRAADYTELAAGNIGGLTLEPGVYKWGTGVLIPTDVTLNGSATDVWIFEIAQDLTMASGSTIFLAGGAVPKNVFWQVSGLVDLGTTAHCEGVVLTATSATLATGASINGRLLAQTAVNVDSSIIVEPAP